MAFSGRVLVILVLILVIHLTEPKGGKGSSRTRSTRTYRYRSRTTGHTTYTGSTIGRGLTWWQICLIIGGIVFAFLILFYCVRACRREPESDTPGIHTTRDQIQLRDHQTVNHFPNSHNACSDGKQIPPPAAVPHTPWQSQQAATAPPPSYEDALDISNAKAPISEGGVDKWEDEEIERKEFGVI